MTARGEKNKKHQNGHLKPRGYSLTVQVNHTAGTGTASQGVDDRLFCRALGCRSNAEEERGRMR